MSWTNYRLEDLGEFKNGVNFSTDKMGKGFPLINVKDITNSKFLNSSKMDLVDLEITGNAESNVAKSGDVFFVRSSVKRDGVGMVGMLDNYDKEVIHCGFVIRFRPTVDFIFSKFLLYLLSSPLYREKIKNLSSGATIVNISQTSLKKLEIHLPLFNTQKSIANILSNYDDLIENNLKRIRLLEETAQNIYKEWFVNFRFPNYEHTEFDAENGLPVGWKVLDLNDVSDVLSSKRVFLSDYVESGIPFYRGKEITQKSNFSEISELYYISQEKFSELESKSGSPNIGDILITGVGTIGNSYLVNEFDEKFYFKDGNLLWIKNIDEKISSEYLIQYFKSIEFSGVVNSISIGSSQKALTISALKTVKIIIPEEKLITDFSNNIKVVLKQINLLFEQLKKLKEARDILLPRLMNRTIEI